MHNANAQGNGVRYRILEVNKAPNAVGLQLAVKLASSRNESKPKDFHSQLQGRHL